MARQLSTREWIISYLVASFFLFVAYVVFVQILILAMGFVCLA
jgi:hypothetical protein